MTSRAAIMLLAFALGCGDDADAAAVRVGMGGPPMVGTEQGGIAFPGAACVVAVPDQWPTDSAGACAALPGTPNYLWEARRESFSDSTNPTTITDYGSAGVTMTQGTASARGTFHSSGGAGDRAYFSFDGGDYWQTAADGPSLSQPNVFALVVYTATTGNVSALDSHDNSPRSMIGPNNTGGWRLLTTSTTLTAASTVVNGEWELIVGTTNGVSSTIRINGVQVTSGDAGAGAYAAGTLGANFSATQFLTGGVALAVVYDTAPDIPTLEAAIKGCYGGFPQ